MKTLQLVISNMENTIRGKEQYLDGLHPNNHTAAMFLDEAEAAVRMATIEFLKVNIAELKRVLVDLRQITES